MSNQLLSYWKTCVSIGAVRHRTNVCETQVEDSKDSKYCMTLYVVSFNHIFWNAMAISFLFLILRTCWWTAFPITALVGIRGAWSRLMKIIIRGLLLPLFNEVTAHLFLLYADDPHGSWPGRQWNKWSRSVLRLLSFLKLWRSSSRAISSLLLSSWNKCVPSL